MCRCAFSPRRITFFRPTASRLAAPCLFLRGASQAPHRRRWRWRGRLRQRQAQPRPPGSRPPSPTVCPPLWRRSRPPLLRRQLRQRHRLQRRSLHGLNQNLVARRRHPMAPRHQSLPRQLPRRRRRYRAAAPFSGRYVVMYSRVTARGTTASTMTASTLSRRAVPPSRRQTPVSSPTPETSCEAMATSTLLNIRTVGSPPTPLAT